MRAFLKHCLRILKEEYSQKPYKYWKTVKLPICFERNFENKNVQVEIDVLEECETFINIVITADRGFFSQYFPARISLIVEKPKPGE